MKRRFELFIHPYSISAVIGYVLGILSVIFLLAYVVLFISDIEKIRDTLPYLGQLMGGAFAFIFSIGVYSSSRFDRFKTHSMPLFTPKMLVYFLGFTVSIILPFINYFSTFNSILFKYFVIFSFFIALICLAFIPLVFVSIRNRYEPRGVLRFLRDNAVKYIENSNDYTPSWSHVTEIHRICMIIYEEEVDTFALGIRCLRSIMIKGVEKFNERNKIIFNNEEIPLSEWSRKMRVRIIWIGQKVVDNPSAFERVIVEIARSKKLLKICPSDIPKIVSTLCKYAKEKDQKESLERVLFYPDVRKICQ